MAPNLFIAARSLMRPHKWFKRHKHENTFQTVQHWDEPVPGTYKYILNKGWCLVAADDQDAPLNDPKPVVYAEALDRYMLKDEFDQRKCYATLRDHSGNLHEFGFFQLDNGVAWIVCWDKDGHFMRGPYKMFCICKESGEFREMLRGDDPEYQSRRNSRQMSASASAVSRSSSSRGRPVVARNASHATTSSLPSSSSSSISVRSRMESNFTALTSPCSSKESVVMKEGPS